MELLIKISIDGKNISDFNNKINSIKNLNVEFLNDFEKKLDKNVDILLNTMQNDLITFSLF